MLETGDYRAILAVIDRTGRATTLEGFAESLLEGAQRELGYETCSVMIAEQTPAGPIATAGAIRGAPDKMDEYLERWRPAEPYEHAAARAEIARYGIGHLRRFHDALDRPQREFCERFLAPDIRDQLAAHLDTGLATQGFFSLYADERELLGPLDRARMITLRPHLANQLRALLAAGNAGSHALRDQGTHSMSARQREVALLAARGLSNAEIGTTLGIAEATVKKHLGAAFKALGLRSRAQLAARVAALRR